MFKKIILFSSIILFLFSGVFAENKKEIKIQKGPTSSPKIVGPKVAPPTKDEIKKIKCNKDIEFVGTDYCKKEEQKIKGFWEWFWDWLKSIF